MQCTHALVPLAGGGSAVALGYFDGVHAGHRRVLRAAQEAAVQNGLQSVVFTFTLPVQGGAGKGKKLLTQTEKERRMAQLGVEQCFEPPFESFCAFTPAQFADEILVRCLQARQVFCGDNFTFGAHKSGTVETLRALCEARGIRVTTVQMQAYENAPVSSSRIRQALAAGDMQTVNTLLEEPYVLDLPVRHGKHLGSTLGFPTINQVYPSEMLVPKHGVYLTQAFVDGVWRAACTGLGTRPTVSGEGVTCETFIPDFSGNLYDATVPVRFACYWKPTVKFASLEELRAYIAAAAAASKAYFAAETLV